jgi:hypothetical protein
MAWNLNGFKPHWIEATISGHTFFFIFEIGFSMQRKHFSATPGLLPGVVFFNPIPYL